MICPHLVSPDVRTEPPATELRAIAVIPVIDEDLKTF